MMSEREHLGVELGMSILGRLSIFGPVRLDLAGAGMSVSVSGDVATIRYPAILRRGFLVWFWRGVRIQIPVPEGLHSSTEVSCKMAGVDPKYYPVAPRAVVADLTGVVRQIRAGTVHLPRSQRISVEVKVPCATTTLLEFPLGEEGKTEMEGSAKTTTVVVRKRAEFSDVVVQNYLWQRSLLDVHPIDSAIVVKNDEQMERLQIDVSSHGSCSGSVSGLTCEADGSYALPNVVPNSRRLTIPLAFERQHDSYRIVIHSRQG